MLRSTLVDKLNKHLIVQAIFVFLPAILIIPYLLFYMYDVLRVFTVLEYNNSILRESNGYIKEVELYEEDSTGDIKAVISGEDSVDLNVKCGDVLYSIQIIGTDWYRLITTGGDIMMTAETGVFDSVSVNDSDEYVITVGDKNYTAVIGDIIADIKLNEQGEYTVVYNDDFERTIDFLPSLQVVLKDGDLFTIKLSTSYSKEMDNIDVSLCNILPSDNMYYDEINQNFVRNVGDDFAKIFILQSNIAVVLISTTLYLVLLCVVRNGDNLILLNNKKSIMCNLCLIVALALAVVMTFWLL